MIALRNVVIAVSLDQQIINQAIDSEITDFEDAIQVFSAKSNSIDLIITRNKSDFANCGIKAIEPGELIQSLDISY